MRHLSRHTCFLRDQKSFAHSDGWGAAKAISDTPAGSSSADEKGRSSYNKGADADRPQSVSGALFAPYQSPFLPYDLTNTFHRTAMSLRIQRAVDGCEDYLALAERLFRTGRMNRDDYITRTAEAAAALRQHRAALCRLSELGDY